MVLIKVQYDAYNRYFKVIDRELARTLEDGGTYVVIADVSIKDLKLTHPLDVPFPDVPSKLVRVTVGP